MVRDIPYQNQSKFSLKAPKKIIFSCGCKMGTFPCVKKIVNNSCYIFQPICWSPPLGKHHRLLLEQGTKKTKII
jgi:hypothetical protein